MPFSQLFWCCVRTKVHTELNTTIRSRVIMFRRTSSCLCRILRDRFNYLQQGKKTKLISTCLIAKSDFCLSCPTFNSTCPVGKSVFYLSCPTFNSTCPLGKLERTGKSSILYHLSRKCAEELCPKCLLVHLSKGHGNTNSHLSHRQNNFCLRWEVDIIFFLHPDTVLVIGIRYICLFKDQRCLPMQTLHSEDH